jgi:hypothetical protein
MDEVFKKKLSELRNPVSPKTFGEALVGNSWLKRTETKKTSKVLIHDEYSEKLQVIESLERFAQEKIKETPAATTIKIDGGEIAVKPEAQWDEILPSADLGALKNGLSLPPAALSALLDHKKPSQIKLLFVAENYHAVEDLSAFKEGISRELAFCFSVKTVEFFERMIMAMKVSPNEVMVYPIEFKEKDLSLETMMVAKYFKPTVVIPLGARASNGILKNNDRLQMIQGQFFKRNLGKDESLTVVPLYHPTIVETNQNMKKMTWASMQKIMEYLKDLS